MVAAALHTVTHTVSAAVPHAPHPTVVAAMTTDLDHGAVPDGDSGLAGYGSNLDRVDGHQNIQSASVLFEIALDGTPLVEPHKRS